MGEAAAAIGDLRAQLAKAHEKATRQTDERFLKVEGRCGTIEGHLAAPAFTARLRRDAADAARSVASDELHGFRESWCRASDYRFDCMLQCLHALYSRAGLP